MLTLITGAPGSGKTAALVSMLAELGKDRQLYIHGIPDLAIPHVKLDEPEKWPELVPDGAVVVIDEVQNVWRPQGPGQKIPEHISKLETHRHRGLDFYVITQGPNLVHSNVRALIGRHVHLRDLGFLGRWWYEWPECCDNCRTAWKGAPIKKKYKLPKQVFGKYKSASLHVKPVRSFPWVVVVLLAAILGAGLLGWMAYRSVTSKMVPEKPVPVQAAAGQNAAVQNAAVGGTLGGQVDERIAFAPRLSGRPWTAPAYDALRTVVRVPYITGAVCLNEQCDCYHHKAKLPEVSSSECLKWAKERPFNPYVADEKPEGDKSRADSSGARAPGGNATQGRSMFDGSAAPATVPAT